MLQKKIFFFTLLVLIIFIKGEIRASSEKQNMQDLEEEKSHTNISIKLSATINTPSSKKDKKSKQQALKNPSFSSQKESKNKKNAATRPPLQPLQPKQNGASISNYFGPTHLKTSDFMFSEEKENNIKKLDKTKEKKTALPPLSKKSKKSSPVILESGQLSLLDWLTKNSTQATSIASNGINPIEETQIKNSQPVSAEPIIASLEGNLLNSPDDLFPIVVSDNEEDSPPRILRKRLRKGRKGVNSQLCRPFSGRQGNCIVIIQGKARRLPYAKTSIASKDESDDESIPFIKFTPFLEIKFPDFPKAVVHMGTQIKLLANVYLKNLDATANIFLPYYILKNSDGLLTKQDFFRTPKDQICVFASGGLHNIWEKTVSSVQEIFFGNKVKIIRASWMQKHLFKDKGIEKNLEEEFRERESELHSEFYYDLFFKHFFLPALPSHKEEKNSGGFLSIHAFSWWDVCTGCEEYLASHRPLLLPPGLTLSYKIAASRRYHHTYPSGSILEEARVSLNEERGAWNKIWSKVSEYAQNSFESIERKEHFWTSTREGLEICKWLGQAFVENTVTLKERKSKPSKKGDILRFYREMTGEETQLLEDLLSYLREKNWELSCWYRQPYPDTVQPIWKRYWRQLVIPHFGWEDVEDMKLEEGGTDYCQMCGNEDLHQVFWVFHPKFRVSESFLSFPKEQQTLREKECGYTLDTPIDELPPVLQKKRKQWLQVGSECVQVLGLSREDLETWREKHLDKEHKAKWEERDKREEDNEALDKAADRELEKKNRQKEKSTKKKRKYNTLKLSLD